jgi:hypothetical protein
LSGTCIIDYDIRRSLPQYIYLANARVEAERAAEEARRVKFVTVDLPRILARSPDQRDRILAVFANMIRDDEMANLTRDEDTVVGEGYEVQRINQGGCANCDTILADAGLTVHGAGYLSYPGEGLVKDGLSYVGNAIHNI